MARPSRAGAARASSAGSAPSADGGDVAVPAAGAKRKGHLRFPFLFELLPFPCFLIWRRFPICDRVDTFRRYEGGGLGAEIQGDVILMGSIGFMKLMKVRMPEGTRLKQAVYLSVNGDLAAVFALNYAPAAGIRSGLNAAVHASGLLPLLATRDFMITPQFLKLRYKIASERVEFPTVEERAQLSEPNAGLGGTQGALLARDSFEGFLAAVSGARAMRGAAIGSIAIAVMGGAMGMLVLTFLTFLGATLSASCWNLFLYTLLWLAPGILITSLSSRR